MSLEVTGPRVPILLPVSRRSFVKSGLGALAACALPGCGDDSPTEVPYTGPRLTARPGTPTLEPAVGLSPLGVGGSRDGVLYVPESYSADTPMPLFVGLHGAGSEGRDWQSYYARAENHGFVLLAPDSRAATWDLLYGQFGADVVFLDQALQHVFDRCLIDPTRIALGGFSDGATYALSLGVSNGDLFTHLVAYSPGSLRPSDPLVGEPRIFISHGTRDEVLPVEVTRDGIVPALTEAGYDVTYREHVGFHEVPYAISEAALAWFLDAD